MGREIERKFLVKNHSFKESAEGTFYRQGYICAAIEGVVRVRTIKDKGYLTIKGKNVGAVRSEFEYEIPYLDAAAMLDTLCEGLLIEKVRYKVPYHGFTWEVDEFLGDNEGLIIAEIELGDENEQFDRPGWIGDEVTGNPKYYNSNLKKNPFKNW